MKAWLRKTWEINSAFHLKASKVGKRWIAQVEILIKEEGRNRRWWGGWCDNGQGRGLIATFKYHLTCLFFIITIITTHFLNLDGPWMVSLFSNLDYDSFFVRIWIVGDQVRVRKCSNWFFVRSWIVGNQVRVHKYPNCSLGSFMAKRFYTTKPKLVNST